MIYPYIYHAFPHRRLPWGPPDGGALLGEEVTSPHARRPPETTRDMVELVGLGEVLHQC